MTRLIGSVLIAAGSAMLGLLVVNGLDQRVGDLAGLAAGLEQMVRELDYRLAPLPELLTAAADAAGGRAGVFFHCAAESAMRLDGRCFRDCWDGALDGAGLRLEPQDRAVLTVLGGVLGRYDGGTQSAALREAAERLDCLQAEAAARRKQSGRVYGALSLTAGAFLLILLI